MEVVHFFSQALMGGTNNFCSVSEDLDDCFLAATGWLEFQSK